MIPSWHLHRGHPNICTQRLHAYHALCCASRLSTQASTFSSSADCLGYSASLLGSVCFNIHAGHSPAAAVPRPPGCQAPAYPHCPNASAIQINLFQLFCAVSLQSHSHCLHTLRLTQGDELVCPSPGKPKAPGTSGVLGKTQKKGSTWLIQELHQQQMVHSSAIQSSWTTGRFPKLGPRIKELSM